MTGIYNKMKLYRAETNPFLKHAKNLVPRIVTFNGIFVFCLIERRYPKTYYCVVEKLRIVDKDEYCRGDVIGKLSLEDYFQTSNRLMSLKTKINLKKIIYDSNRNK